MTARQSQRRPGLGAMPGPWVNDAACRDSLVPDAWHATDSQSGEMAYALSICRGCEVRRSCLDFALSLAPSDAQGINGGTTAEQRRRMWKARGTAA